VCGGEDHRQGHRESLALGEVAGVVVARDAGQHPVEGSGRRTGGQAALAVGRLALVATVLR